MKKLLFLLVFCFNFSFSQIPTRLIINTGFEQPSLGCTNCFNLFPDVNVPGWNTTDPTAVIEIWGTNFQSKTSHSGNQFAEINANNSAFLYQEICLAANESVNYSIWYLKRTANTEQMKAQLTDVNNNVISSSVTYTASSTWKNYTGTLTNNGTAGLRRIGFVAVTGGSTGNLIDDITISLKPLASLSSFIAPLVFEGTPTQLKLVVNGTLLSNATVTIGLSGTATNNNDYTIGNPSKGALTATSNSISLTLPAGDYDPNTNTGSSAGIVTIPFNTIIDGIPEADETITCSITSISGGGNGSATMDLIESINGNGSSCGSYASSVTATLCNTSPLPITLVNFKVSRNGTSVLVKWATATETDNDYFTIFRSRDAFNYEEAGRIDGAGTTNFFKAYQFIDAKPYSGISYYFLRQTDYDGNHEDFPPVSVKVDGVIVDDIWKKWNFLGQEIK